MSIHIIWRNSNNTYFKKKYYTENVDIWRTCRCIHTYYYIFWNKKKQFTYYEEVIYCVKRAGERVEQSQLKRQELEQEVHRSVRLLLTQQKTSDDWSINIAKIAKINSHLHIIYTYLVSISITHRGAKRETLHVDEIIELFAR